MSRSFFGHNVSAIQQALLCRSEKYRVTNSRAHRERIVGPVASSTRWAVARRMQSCGFLGLQVQIALSQLATALRNAELFSVREKRTGARSSMLTSTATLRMIRFTVITTRRLF